MLTLIFFILLSTALTLPFVYSINKSNGKVIYPIRRPLEASVLTAISLYIGAMIATGDYIFTPALLIDMGMVTLAATLSHAAINFLVKRKPKKFQNEN